MINRSHAQRSSWRAPARWPGSPGAALWFQLFRRPLPKTAGRLIAARRRRAARDPARPLRRAARLRAHAARPVLRARLLPRPGPALAARVLPPRDGRAPVRVRGAGRAARRPPDAHARHAPGGRARGARDRRARCAALAGAYVAGINAAIEAAAALPIEFQLLRLDPEPWTAVDLLASAKLMGFGLSTNWEMELLRAELVRAAGPGAGRAPRAAVPAGEPGRDRARRRLRGRRRRHRGADRGGQGLARPRACTRPARTTGSSRASARVTGQAAAGVRPAPDHHDPRPLVRGRPRLRRLPRARRDAADEPVPRVRPDRLRGLGLHERDGRHAGPVRRAPQPRRRAPVRVRGRLAAGRRRARGDPGQGPRQARGAGGHRHPPRPDRERGARRHPSRSRCRGPASSTRC